MAIEDKYLKETVGFDISTEKRYKKLISLAYDLEDYGKKIGALIYIKDFNMKTLGHNSKEIDRELNKRKMILMRIRNRAQTQEFKNIVDECIDFLSKIGEGYWQDVDTSREGT